MIVNISAIVAAVAAVVTAVAVIVVGSRLTRFLQSAELLVRDSDQVVRRLQSVAEEAERVARDARRVETRLTGMFVPLLDQVEPPLRIARSLMAGLQAGLGAWLRTDGSKSDPSTPHQQESQSREALHER